MGKINTREYADGLLDSTLKRDGAAVAAMKQRLEEEKRRRVIGNFKLSVYNLYNPVRFRAKEILNF